MGKYATVTRAEASSGAKLNEKLQLRRQDILYEVTKDILRLKPCKTKGHITMYLSKTTEIIL